VAPEKRRDPEHGGKPDGPCARLLAGAGTITRAQRVVQFIQGPAAAGAAKVLANAVHKAGGCFRVPHQVRRTVCARRSHSRGARAAGERETGLRGAGPGWAGAGLGLGRRSFSLSFLTHYSWAALCGTQRREALARLVSSRRAGAKRLILSPP
jgi:hypothetical protein